MTVKPASRPPRPGELWILDEAWNPAWMQSDSDKKIALVISAMCAIDKDGLEEFEEITSDPIVSDPLDPLYRSLVEGYIVDLHWTWFRSRLSHS